MSNQKRREEENLFEITESAREYLASLLGESGHKENTVVRFVLNEGKVDMQVGTELQDDLSFSHNGRKVLVLSNTVADRLRDYRLELDKSGKSPNLVLKVETTH